MKGNITKEQARLVMRKDWFFNFYKGIVKVRDYSDGSGTIMCFSEFEALLNWAA